MPQKMNSTRKGRPIGRATNAGKQYHQENERTPQMRKKPKSKKKK